jgi:WD40 repeat protein
MAPATLLKSLEGCNGDIRDAVLSPDNSLLAIRSSNGRCINIYDVNSGSLQARTTSHENMIWDLSFSGSNKYVLSACDDGIARLFSTATGAHPHATNISAFRTFRLSSGVSPQHQNLSILHNLAASVCLYVFVRSYSLVFSLCLDLNILS